MPKELLSASLPDLKRVLSDKETAERLTNAGMEQRVGIVTGMTEETVQYWEQILQQRKKWKKTPGAVWSDTGM